MCLFLCCSNIIQAEIHWKPVSNGFPKNIQQLDIDGDGITDLTLSIVDNVAIFDGEHFIIKMAKVFGSPSLEIMSCQLGNKGILCGYLTDNGQTYGWWNNGAKYLGFKRILNNGIYYGWLKVELTNQGWQIFEYAYEDCPTVAILSGAKQGGANCPIVTAITRTKSSPTRLNEINFRVKFSHNVTAIDLMDFALSTTDKINGASIINLSGKNDTYIVSVNTGTGDGTIRLDLINNFTIKSTNNLLLKASFTDGQIYKIDKTPPNTIIYSKPLNPSSKKNPVHFIFSGNEILNYECQLDSGNFEKCISPIYIKSLNAGSHTFKVRAIDKAGNIDPTPASYTWIINNEAIKPLTGLIINEIDYDQAAIDNSEFIEIKNISNDSINLEPYEIQLIEEQNNHARPYKNIFLPKKNLNAGDYYVICSSAAKVDNCDQEITEIDFIKDGVPNAIALIYKQQETIDANLLYQAYLVDTISYEGNIKAPYTETIGTEIGDNNKTKSIGLSRWNGIDTNNNNQDFGLRCITPGKKNTAASINCLKPPPISIPKPPPLPPKNNPITINKAGTVITEIKVEKNDHLSNGILDHTLNNNGQVSDITITTGGVIIGGIVSGNIKSEGVIINKKAPALLTNVILTQDVKLAADVSLHNVELRGASITGNHLSGNIRVTSSETVIKNVSLAANTTITGGKLAGKITTDKKAPALLKNVILTPDVKLAANVSLHNVELRGASINGNHLSGDIRVTSSATLIKNVSLGANTTITGGKLTGRIRGDKQSPAVLQHLIIEQHSHLTDVIIADGVDLPKQVNLGLGVRFTSKENIPEGLDLTSILPKLNSGVDLSIDVIVGGKGILAAINRLPEFTASNLTIKQSKQGYLYLDIEDKRYAVNPKMVKHLSDSPNLLVEIGQNIRFKTDTEIDVFAPPAIQAPETLQMALKEFKIDIDDIGNIQVTAKDQKQQWFSARANLFSIEVENDTTTGLSVKENNVFALVFIDKDGKKREQHFYPAPDDLATLVKIAQEVDLTTEGILSFKLETISYEGKLDYLVKQGTVPENKALKVEEMIDNNNFLITYPNGAKQSIIRKTL
ncbi:lamin tail domain-containing protein [Candidatus Marithrix sp. Canyon 246]|uniref:lamin tail domain-containing protein n=1 Tax=Candidatus Marithrix sp. Canyon 246 TaxID=1827136 RepID=UPI00084A2D9C|nr:lamin tail domain-containing protein [Candidatus Marithrix sp. Canyon 246]